VTHVAFAFCKLPEKLKLRPSRKSQNLERLCDRLFQLNGSTSPIPTRIYCFRALFPGKAHPIWFITASPMVVLLVHPGLQSFIPSYKVQLCCNGQEPNLVRKTGKIAVTLAFPIRYEYKIFCISAGNNTSQSLPKGKLLSWVAKSILWVYSQKEKENLSLRKNFSFSMLFLSRFFQFSKKKGYVESFRISGSIKIGSKNKITSDLCYLDKNHSPMKNLIIAFLFIGFLVACQQKEL